MLSSGSNLSEAAGFWRTSAMYWTFVEAKLSPSADSNATLGAALSLDEIVCAARASGAAVSASGKHNKSRRVLKLKPLFVLFALTISYLVQNTSVIFEISPN